MPLSAVQVEEQLVDTSRRRRLNTALISLIVLIDPQYLTPGNATGNATSNASSATLPDVQAAMEQRWAEQGAAGLQAALGEGVTVSEDTDLSVTTQPVNTTITTQELQMVPCPPVTAAYSHTMESRMRCTRRTAPRRAMRAIICPTPSTS